MATDFSKPVPSDGYVTLLQGIVDNVQSVAKWMEGVTGPSLNVPTGAKRLNGGLVEEWSGSAWTEKAMGYLKTSGGTLTGALTAPRYRATSTTDISLTSTLHAFQIGADNGDHVAIDTNEIASMESFTDGIGNTSKRWKALYINPNGGDVLVGSNPDGTKEARLAVNTPIPVALLQVTRDATSSGNSFNPANDARRALMVAWRELSNQDLGGGEGAGISFGVELIGDGGSATTVASVYTYKASGTDTSRASHLCFGVSSDGAADVTEVARCGTDLIFRSNNAAALIGSLVTLTNAAGASTATLTNAPSAGNPTKWIQINDNGTIRKIPTWL